MIYFIIQHSTIIIIILTTWIIGIIIGVRIGQVRKFKIENKNIPKDEKFKITGNNEFDAFRFKREYIINVIIGDEKGIDYKGASDIILQVEDNVGKNKIKKGGKYKIVLEEEVKKKKPRQTNQQIEKNKEKPTDTEGKTDFFEDVEKMFNPSALK